MKTLGFYIEPLTAWGYFGVGAERKWGARIYGYAPVVCELREVKRNGFLFPEYIRPGWASDTGLQRFTKNFDTYKAAREFMRKFFQHHREPEKWQFVGELHYMNYQTIRHPELAFVSVKGGYKLPRRICAKWSGF